MIEAVTNSGIKYDDGEETVDVCQAIQEMRKESEQKKAQEVAGNLYKMGLFPIGGYSPRARKRGGWCNSKTDGIVRIKEGVLRLSE